MVPASDDADIRRRRLQFGPAPVVIGGSGIRFALVNYQPANLTAGGREDAVNLSSGPHGQMIWRRCPLIGLLLIGAFLTHDLAMAGLAAAGGNLLVLAPLVGSNARVVHGPPGGDHAPAALDRAAHHQCDDDACLPPSCDLHREAVPATSDLLDSTLQAMPGGIAPIMAAPEPPRPTSFAGASFRSSRDQRTMLGVFLI